MAIPGSGQVSLKDILDEKQEATTAQINVSLRGLSVDGTNDYQNTDITGTPDGDPPYGIAEFHGYEHSGTIGDITYLTVGHRQELGNWSQTAYGLYETSTESGTPEESEADGGIYLFTKQVSGETWLYADRIIPSENDADTDEGRRYSSNGPPRVYDSMGSNSSNDGSTADVIVKIDTANVIVTCSVNLIYGWGDEQDLTGKDTPNLSANSGATYVANSAQGASEVSCSGAGGSQDAGVIWRMQLAATKSGFTTKPINFNVANGQLSAYSYHSAVSDEEDGGDP